MSRQKPITLNRKQKFALAKLDPYVKIADLTPYVEGTKTYVHFKDKVLVWWAPAMAWLPAHG